MRREHTQKDPHYISLHQLIFKFCIAKFRRRLTKYWGKIGAFGRDHGAWRRAELKTKVSELMEFKKEAKSEIASLEDRVQSPSQSLQNYKLVRGRFIPTFKRDVLGTATDAGRKIIRGGNIWARGGDAIVDAQLYESPGGRRL